jgi:hypothetical protein
MYFMAVSAASRLSKLTKPKPRLRPVSRSTMILECTYHTPHQRPGQDRTDGAGGGGFLDFTLRLSVLCSRPVWMTYQLVRSPKALTVR